MFPSYPVRMLVIGAALQFCSVDSFAQASGISCQAGNNGTVLTLSDGLDDLGVGPLGGPLTRACGSASAWPDGTYTVTASHGPLAVIAPSGAPDLRSLMLWDQGAKIVFSDFASTANSFAMSVHGGDRNGNYVRNTVMVITIKGVDGFVLWGEKFMANDPAYSYSYNGHAKITSVELRRLLPQPDGIDDSLAVIDAFTVSHGGTQASETPDAKARR